MHKSRIMRVTTAMALFAVTLCLLGADKARSRHAAAKRGPVFRSIPVGAIKNPSKNYSVFSGLARGQMV